MNRKNTLLDSQCSFCGKKFKYRKSTSFGKYCSNKCQVKLKQKTIKEEWFSGKRNTGQTRSVLKNILVEMYGHICMSCNLSVWKDCPIALELDHKNGDPSDDRPENVWVICPNCHATTKSWKGRNKGNGRKSMGLPLY